jgi:hypothetical protein
VRASAETESPLTHHAPRELSDPSHHETVPNSIIAVSGSYTQVHSEH